MGLPTNYIGAHLHPEVEAAYAHVKSALAVNPSIVCVPVDMSRVWELNSQLDFKLILTETHACFTEYLAENKIGLTLLDLFDQVKTPDVQFLLAENVVAPTAKAEYARLQAVRKQLVDEYRALFERVDVLAYPTLACLPIAFEEIREPETDVAFCRNCNASSHAGLPSLSVPMGRCSRGLPIGLNIDAKWDRDRFLLGVGRVFVGILDRERHRNGLSGGL